jgi:opacity protein-like surface antigen
MKPARLQSFLAAILCIYSTGTSATDHRWRLDIDALLTRYDSNRGSDFHSTQAISIRGGLYLNDYLALESGAVLNNRVIDDTRKDIAGYYQASLEQQSLLLGLRASHRFTSPYEIYARLGLAYARTELEITEAFADNTPPQSVSASDRTLGYYLAFGGTHFITPTIEAHLEFGRQSQTDLFSDRSRYPFDLDALSLGFGIGILF